MSTLTLVYKDADYVVRVMQIAKSAAHKASALNVLYLPKNICHIVVNVLLALWINILIKATWIVVYVQPCFKIAVNAQIQSVFIARLVQAKE